MQFSEQWLREWVNPNASTEELVAELTMAGLEVDGVEPVAGEFSGVVVGQVKEKTQHPDADKLSLCKVDVNGEALLDIVCGAANVREGLKIPVAVVGAVLPGDFKIKKAKLRGEPSFGMLCAESELGLSDSSDGLMELAEDAPVGEDFRQYLGLDDQIIDVDLTPNRSDCLGIAGIAREVGVLYRQTVNAIKIEPVKPTIDDVFPVAIDAKEQCARYVGRVIKNVDVQAKTPLWMVEKLRRSGIRSIDPIVDVTNYVLLELGQPMHAFDMNQLEGGICVRLANDKEKIILLDGQEIELKQDTLLIADAGRALAIAGVMGGAESGVTTETKDIFLESAYFNPIAIAGKARSYGLHTDSSHRFERGVDYELQSSAMERATQLLLDIVGGDVGPIIDITHEEFLPQKTAIQLRESRIARVLGFSLPQDEVTDILTRLGLGVTKNDEGWKVISPSYRFDVSIEADLIEELGRIYGYNNLPTVIPTLGYSQDHTPEVRMGLPRIRRLLVDLGYQEAISYSFVEPSLLEKLDPGSKPLALANPISADMSVMRTTLWAGLIKTAQHNQARQQQRLQLFETGLRFVPGESGLIQDLEQERMIAGLVVGSVFQENWTNEKRVADFFDVKGHLETVFDLGQAGGDFSFSAGEHPALHPGQTAVISKGRDQIGLIGALHPSLIQEFGLNGTVYLFELKLSAILDGKLPQYQELSKFPEMRRDIAVIVDESTTSQEITTEIRQVGGDSLKSVNIFDVYQGNSIDAGKKSLALSLTFQHPSRTLKDSEVSEVVEQVVLSLKQKFKAILRE